MLLCFWLSVRSMSPIAAQSAINFVSMGTNYVKRSDVTRWEQGYATPPPPYFIVLASSVKIKDAKVIEIHRMDTKVGMNVAMAGVLPWLGIQHCRMVTLRSLQCNAMLQGAVHLLTGVGPRPIWDPIRCIEEYELLGGGRGWSIGL